VLYPAPLRDLLMHLAVADLYRAKWTDEIHTEWIRSLLANRPDLTEAQLERTRALMNAHSRDCLVSGYQDLVSKLALPDPNDRHVAAAAIHCGAELIVTFNLGDFPADSLTSFGIRVIHPDDFLTETCSENIRDFCQTVRRQRQSLKAPPKQVEAYLETLLRQGLPKTIDGLRPYYDQL